MNVRDLSGNQKIANLLTLSPMLAKAVTPVETLQAVTETIQKSFGPATFMGLSTRDLPRGSYRVVQLRVDGAPIDGLNSWENSDSPVRSDGLLSQIISNHKPQLIHDLDWSQDPYMSEILVGYNSLMAIPMEGDRLPIDWAIVMAPGNSALVEKDFEEFILRTTLIGSLLNSRALGLELAAAHSHIDREFKEMGKLQRSLLPSARHVVPGLDIAAAYQTSTRTGGDIYDIFPEQETGENTTGSWCIFVGDATGHGAAAAVVIAIVQAVLRALPASMTVSQRMGFVNQHLCRRGLNSAFATAFFAVYHSKSHVLTYASAGHPMPLLLATDKTTPLELPGKPGLLLGADPSAPYTESTHQLKKGEMLLIYTDGITEARAPDGGFLETAGLAIAFENRPANAGELIGRIQEIVLQHQGSANPADDQTAIAIFKR